MTRPNEPKLRRHGGLNCPPPGKADDPGRGEMEPVGAGVMTGSALHSEGGYVPPVDPVVVPPVGAALPDDSYGTPVGTTGPYTVVTAKGLAGEDRWDVVDSAGVSTGYVNEDVNTQAEAEAQAAFLNGGPVTETVTYTD